MGEPQRKAVQRCLMLQAMPKHMPKHCLPLFDLAMHARTHATYRELLTLILKLT